MTPRAEPPGELRSAGWLPDGARVRLEGDVGVEGEALRFPPRAAAIVVEIGRPAGHYSLVLSVAPPVPMRVEIVAGGRPVPLPLAGKGETLRGDFALDRPLEALRLMPVVDGRIALRRLAVAERAPSPALLPPWRIGAVSIPARSADAPVEEDTATPDDWTGCALLARQGVAREGAALHVGPGGALLLALTEPRAGWWRCEAEFTTVTGEAALVEPRVAAHPDAPLDGSILRPAGATLHGADVRVGADGLVVFRPRTERGSVVVRRLRFRPLRPGDGAARVLRPLGLRARAAAGRFSAALPGRLRLPPPPPRAFGSVSVVIATRDAPRHLGRCLETLAATATDVETVLVDNGSTDPAALRLLATARERGAIVLSDDRPFNFAALANLGARAASGEALVFANNDIVFSRPGWLEHLLAPLASEAVGVTGARLLYPDGRLQHGGVVLAGESRVRHAERFLPWWHPGHAARQRVTTPVTAVTGALLATRRGVFDAVGGFDAGRYGVLYNDVDFCLRVARAGLSVLYVPTAEAIHAESVTIGAPRPADPFARGGAVWRLMRAVEADNFRVDWAGLADRDPWYPASFDPVAADFRPRRRGSTWPMSSDR